MRAFDYQRAESIETAQELLRRGATGLAGGTDLLTLMKADLVQPRALVDLKALPGMRDIRGADDGTLSLGALTTVSEIEHSEVIQRRAPALARAASLAATPQIRNRATLAGNLLQRPRCWYYRSPETHCWLEGGEECLAREGENQMHAIFANGPCHAVHPSDLAPVLVALGATLRLAGGTEGIERSTKVEELYAAPEDDRRQETRLGDGELITEVTIPAAPEGSQSTYLKAMDRRVWAFALASVAVQIGMHDGEITHANIVCGGVANVPHRAHEAERALIGSAPSDALFSRAVALATEEARPLSKNGYKVPLLRNLLLHAFEECTRGE